MLGDNPVTERMADIQRELSGYAIDISRDMTPKQEADEWGHVRKSPDDARWKLIQEYKTLRETERASSLDAGIGERGNVMPVYLSIENPLVHDFRGRSYRDKSYAELINKAIKEGHDGLILHNTYDTGPITHAIRDETDVYIAFHPEQIKSATGNTGDFDGTNPDIRFSRSSGAAGWEMPESTRFDDLAYKLQDKQIDVKRVVQSIRETGKAVADAVNVYLQETLYHGRVATRVNRFQQGEMADLMASIGEAGFTIDQVEEYLQARHAKEANALIAQRNPNEPGLQDGGSGMTDADADAYMASLSVPDRKRLERIASQVDAIIAETRQLYVDYGLESRDTVDGWAKMFEHYVPLHREGRDTPGMGIGQGFSVKGREVRGRTGSTRKVVDILANIALQREKVITRGEKNRVSNALVGLATMHPNKEIWTVGEAPTERVFDPAQGVVVDRVDPLYKSRDNVVVAKVQQRDGSVREVAVTFNPDNERAVRMAQALKNLDAPRMEGLMGTTAKATRYFAAVNTQWNPIFGVVNFTRDVQEAMLNLQSTPLKGKQVQIARDTGFALSGIWRQVRAQRDGKNDNSYWGKLFRQFQEDGGQTGYRDMWRTGQERAEELQRLLTPDGWAQSGLGKVMTAGGLLTAPMEKIRKSALAPIFNGLSDYNEAMENAVRLAAYKSALDSGMSREQAAALAKDLTVNFNRKGQMGSQMSAMYAFFNATMQGTQRMAETLFTMEAGKPNTLRLSRVGQQIVTGGLLLGALQAVALAGFSDEDPPPFVRERNLIVPIPFGGKQYLTIPMPLGMHILPNIGRNVTEFAMSGFANPADRVATMMGLFADAFNPIGNAGLSMQTIVPTVLDPLAALSENRDFTGRPIARRSLNKAEPGHTQGKDTATAVAKFISEAINMASGGNQYRAGFLSPTPDQIDYLIAQATGGVGREYSKLEQVVTSTISGEALPPYKIPLWGRFYGNARSQASEGTAFYAALDRLNALDTEIKNMRKAGHWDKAASLRQSRPDAVMIRAAGQARRQVTQLRNMKSMRIKQGASRRQVREIDDRITNVMRSFNQRFAAIQL